MIVISTHEIQRIITYWILFILFMFGRPSCSFIQIPPAFFFHSEPKKIVLAVSFRLYAILLNSPYNRATSHHHIHSEHPILHLHNDIIDRQASKCNGSLNDLLPWIIRTQSHRIKHPITTFQTQSSVPAYPG